jgi:hypothetical protein
MPYSAALGCGRLTTIPYETAALLAFFKADRLLVDAAAIDIPTFNAQGTQYDSIKTWMAGIAGSRRNEIIQRLLSKNQAAVKAELLSEICASQPAATWPVEPATRNAGQLLKTCDVLRQRKNEILKKKAAAKVKREAENAEKLRQARMIEMRSDSEPWLKKASKLAEERGTDKYRDAASILADLRDALGGERRKKIARYHAAHLAKTFPTLTMLKSSLRKFGLLD